MKALITEILLLLQLCVLLYHNNNNFSLLVFLYFLNLKCEKLYAQY